MLFCVGVKVGILSWRKRELWVFVSRALRRIFALKRENMGFETMKN